MQRNGIVDITNSHPCPSVRPQKVRHHPTSPPQISFLFPRIACNWLPTIPSSSAPFSHSLSYRLPQSIAYVVDHDPHQPGSSTTSTQSILKTLLKSSWPTTVMASISTTTSTSR